MKGTLLLGFCSVLSFLIAPVHALPPLPQRPLEDRVRAASHIFIGVAEKMTIMDRNGEVKPQPNVLNLGQYALLDVRVEEALTPAGWKPTTTVRVPFSGGLWEVAPIRDSLMGRKYIYLTKIELRGPEGLSYISSYGYFLTEPVTQKDEILKLVKFDPVAAERWSHWEWIAQCLRRIESVPVGISRDEFQKVFDLERPYGDRYGGKYVFRDCPFIAIDMEFTPTTPDQPKDRYHARDKVVKLSKPYLEWPGGSHH